MDQAGQLEQRIDTHELDAGASKDLFFRDLLKDEIHHAFGAIVSIAHGVTQQAAILVQQAKIHAPGIDANASRTMAFAVLDTGLYFRPELQKIPVECSVNFHGPIGEPVQFLQLKFAAIKMDGHHPTGFRAQVNSSVAATPRSSSLSSSSGV